MMKTSAQERKPFDLSCMITDGALRLVEEAAKKTNTKDRYALLDYICADMEKRYPGDSLEYHLSQMRIATTKDILEIIDLYLVMVEFEPGTTFTKHTRKKKEE